jgi:hypothetical protein
MPAETPPWPGPVHVKRRARPEPGSIPDVLDIFRAEVRFYREIAPVIGVRVPACYRAEETARWDEVIAAYGPPVDLAGVLPAVAAQGLFSLSGTTAGSAEASGWVSRLEAADRRLAPGWPA